MPPQDAQVRPQWPAAVPVVHEPCPGEVGPRRAIRQHPSARPRSRPILTNGWCPTRSGEAAEVEDFCRRRRVVPCMWPINEAPVAKPGPAVVEIAACDDQTAFAVQELLAARWTIAPADRTTRQPGEPGVRLRCPLDLGQEPDSATSQAQAARRRPG
ncbi:DUF6207 family protein [Streptomyces sp. NPDC093982]|uniref:DUF6207 family protein n=1 Tax=Streptomyces sp. NPDC093982 TaxID=3155077 RepID=UPI00342A562B